MGKPRREITIGERFGGLVVLQKGEPHKEVLKNRIKNLSTFVCQCDCGIVKTIQQKFLLDGDAKSCGCRITQKLHELTKTAEYITHQGMIQRCYNSSNSEFKHYGGRGISVCERWLEPAPQGFLNFLEDMGERPEDMSLDRVDVNGNYTPENCRWEVRSKQAWNKRVFSKNALGVTGVRFKDNKYESYIGVDGKFIYLGRFLTLEEAKAAREKADLTYYGELKSCEGGEQ